MNSKKTYNCSYCNKEFSSINGYKSHSNTCNIKKEVEFCNKKEEEFNVLLRQKDFECNEKIDKALKLKDENINFILDKRDKEYQNMLKNMEAEYKEELASNKISVIRLETIIDQLEQTNEKANNQIHELQDKLNQYIYGQSTSSNSVKTNNVNVFNVQIEETGQVSEPEIPIEHKVNEKPLVLNEIVIPTRYIDNYVNLTEMCRAGNKLFKNWRQLEKTKEFLDELSRSAGIPADLLIKVISRGPNEQRGSWGHPQVAVNVAQWISPKFDVEVSRHILELYTTGSTEIKNSELTQELQDKNEKIKYLENAHGKLLKKRNYHKFKEGPIFYIISDNDSKSLKCKPGMDGEDINVRLQQHRSTTPEIKLEYLIYTDKCALIENTILEKYSTRRKFLNHEWVFDVEIQEVIASVKTLLKFLGVEYTEEIELEKYNSQIETLY